MNETKNEMSRVIARTAGKNVMFDLQDRLSPSAETHYAMVHGSGGKYGYNSCIKATICDYSAGKGDKSVTVSANLDIEVISIIKAVAENRIVVPETPVAQAAMIANASISNNAIQAINNMGKQLAAYQQNNTLDIKTVAQLYQTIKTGITAPSNTTAQPKAQYDYSYVSDKVNVYKKNDDDTAPCTRISISRQGIMPDGSKKRVPWSITIITGIAPITTMANGATTFNAQKMKDTKKATINVSDIDMYRMMDAAERYIRVWENVQTARVRNAVAMMNNSSN